MGGGPTYQGSVETTKDMMDAYIKSLPDLVRVTGQNMQPMEQALVDTQRAIAPQQAQTSLDLARHYLPDFTQLGIDQAAQQAQGQAKSDLDLMNGTGRQLAQAALAQQKELDPEYYATRGDTAGAIHRLLASLDDPNGGLSGAEREEVTRSLARDNAARGNLSPTAESTVQSAMQMGSAGAARKSAKQQAMAQAIGSATGAMPAMKSGMDALQLTTGRPATPNVGLGQFGGVQSVGNNTMALGGQLLNQAGTFAGQNQQNRATQKDFFDKFQQTMQGIGSVVSCCWVFAEVYGGFGKIPWYVRASRDAYATAQNRAGYRRFAKVVVPLMQRSALCRKLVMLFLVCPMTAHAGSLVGRNRYGILFTPLQRAWLGFFHLLGALDGTSVEVFG